MTCPCRICQSCVCETHGPTVCDCSSYPPDFHPVDIKEVPRV